MSLDSDFLPRALQEILNPERFGLALSLLKYLERETWTEEDLSVARLPLETILLVLTVTE